MQNKENENQLKQKSIEIVHKAFLECERSKKPAIIALGAFLDKAISILIKVYQKDNTASLLERLAQNVRNGLYDKRPQ